ncbi:class I adenylate-forming enzyme family protein [Amycolatopsis sp. CA-230715]|uniref:class I adenylate-forming enzyme family protein n=1 Tax=Amycolatopsis sp. CA-230715 TaxID=2745196 RepID=UPI001C01316C|nr:class I adenylate-forming enzyme family protein [Amycolatopsis sp. CA-230715]QWF76794.1 Anthranilate--CoA ligase [Amycolatopsis sp. CA-230715]
MTGKLFHALATSLAAHQEAVVGSLAERVHGPDLLTRADAKRARLDEVVAPAARVAVIRRNSPGYVSDLLAVLGGGHVPFLMDPSLGTSELAKLFADCGIDAVLHDEVPKLPPVGGTVAHAGTRLSPTGRAGARPDLLPDTELCRLTSGSTRTPGCIEFSGAAVLGAAEGWRVASGMSEEDRILCFAGLYNGLGFNAALIPGLLAGASIHLPAGLPTAGNIRRHLTAVDPTVLVAFPAAYDSLAGSGGAGIRGHRPRLALSSAARLAPDTSAALARHGIRIADYYGIAETGPLTFNPDPVPGGGQGYPLPGVSLRFENGTLLAKSPSMGSRYLNYPGALEDRITESGHYRSSDQGSLTGRGELVLGERVDDSFSVGGKKFTAAEVEDLLGGHPEIDACSATMVAAGTGRPYLGAIVVARGAIDVVALRRYCLDRAAPFKVPERIVQVPEIPRNGAGKTQRAEVARLLAQRTDD